MLYLKNTNLDPHLNYVFLMIFLAIKTFPLQGGDPGPLQEAGKPGLSECRGRASTLPQGDSTPATGKTGSGKLTQCEGRLSL